eukprot:6292719-Alexandrium_andersonii.AAC.1
MSIEHKHVVFTYLPAGGHLRARQAAVRQREHELERLKARLKQLCAEDAAGRGTRKSAKS